MVVCTVCTHSMLMRAQGRSHSVACMYSYRHTDRHTDTQTDRQACIT